MLRLLMKNTVLIMRVHFFFNLNNVVSKCNDQNERHFDFRDPHNNINGVAKL